MKVWKYSGGIDKYPVRAGDIWLVGDKHVFVCGDLQGESCIDKVVADLRPQLLYSDPPWNDGNAKAFRTKSGVDGSIGRKVKIETLIERVLGFAKTLRIPAFIEGGMKEIEMNKQTIAKTSGVLHQHWRIKYSKHLSCMIYFADYRDNPVNDFDFDLTGEDDIQTPYYVVNHYKPNYVLDPCGGRGTTAVMAGTAGCGSILHELSATRMADAIMHTANILELKASLVSRL